MGTWGKYDVHSEAFCACKAASRLAFSYGEWQLYLLCRFTFFSQAEDSGGKSSKSRKRALTKSVPRGIIKSMKNRKGF